MGDEEAVRGTKRPSSPGEDAAEPPVQHDSPRKRARTDSPEDAAGEADDWNEVEEVEVAAGGTAAAAAAAAAPPEAMEQEQRHVEDDDDDDLDSDESDDGPEIVQPQASSSMTFAERMMKNMGHVEGTGLGKHGQGRIDPVLPSTQISRHGLGLKIEGLEAKTYEDHELEQVEIHQDPEWITVDAEDTFPDFEACEEWIITGERELAFEKESPFYTYENLKDVLEAKSVLDSVDGKTLNMARSRANPFEMIKGEFCQNRAALKMANMDAVFDFMFTRAAQPDKLLYFADICAGPGGFTEYVLWRTKWRAKGYGFTLRGEKDFKLARFNQQSPRQCFHCYYGVDNTGDIYNTESMRAFQALVRKDTKDSMLDFVMADGGFDVTGVENYQEIMNKQLLLCQFVTGLALLRPGGHYVCKAFDVFTTFSVGLIYLMYLAFDQVCVIKPRTSRPANSERYLVCKGLKKGVDINGLVEYMWRVNDVFNNNKNRGLDKEPLDVVQIVPIERMSRTFIQYMRTSNDFLAQVQVYALKKLHKFLQDRNLPSENQEQIRLGCLTEWDLPTNRVEKISSYDPMAYALTMVDDRHFRKAWGRPLTKDYVHGKHPILRRVHDWICIPSSSEEVVLVVGMPNGDTYFWKKSDGWKRFANLDLPMGTLVLCEKVRERDGRRFLDALHVIDAAYLGQEHVSTQPFARRLQLATMFAEAINSPSECQAQTRRGIVSPFRVNSSFPLARLERVLSLPDGSSQNTVGSTGRGALIPACNMLICTVSPFAHKTWPILGVICIPVQTPHQPQPPDEWQLGTDQENRKIYVHKHTTQTVFMIQDMKFRTSLEACVQWHRGRSPVTEQELLEFIEHQSSRQ
eukprot:m.176408 g.176408  ORF g.176408 m.176408 type:complete len:858 (-) comp10430_c0_seq2:82-2655(-)